MLRAPAIIVVSALAAACASTTRDVPAGRDGTVPGWFLSGPRLQAFRVGVDREVHFTGAASGRLESSDKSSGAGTLMQSVAPDTYLGQRLRFSAAVRTQGVEGWTGLWMRVDRPDGRATFDNMQQRPLRGTNEWTRAEVVLDVAHDATAIHFGLLQDGRGISWLDDVTLEPVGKDVATTAIDPHPRALANADFEGLSELGPGREREPKGWSLQGLARADFVATVDHEERHGGAASARLANEVEAPRGHAMLAQSIRADLHAGTRVRVSAWIKSRGVERGGSFGITSYAADAGPTSPGLTRAHCGLGGTTEWHRCEGVLDVPPYADTLEIALGLQGKGTAWMDDVRIEPVGLDVPVSDVDERPRDLVNGDCEAGHRSPTGWFLSGTARAHYEAVVDTVDKHGGKQSARLQPRVKDPQGYGSMMQELRAHDFRGKRLRMTAWVKGKDIDARGDMWLRVQAADSPGDGGGLGGGRCTLSGTFDWKPCTVVFDVPQRGDAIDIGVGLDPHGTIWLDDVKLEEVDPSVPLSRESTVRTRLDDGGFETAVGSPRGWFVSGNAKKDYAATVDRSVHAEGAASVRLAPKTTAPGGYGSLMTSLLAESYRGKRMRMSAQVRGRGVTGRGDMWLRVQAQSSPPDGPGLGGGSCTLAGDFEWKPCTVVFDVPERGVWIEMGLGVAGPGTVWLDDVKLEEVDKTAPLTSVVRERAAPDNLGFER